MGADRNNEGMEETLGMISTPLFGQFIQAFIRGLQENASTKNKAEGI
jgi:hypothetical protein